MPPFSLDFCRAALYNIFEMFLANHLCRVPTSVERSRY